MSLTHILERYDAIGVYSPKMNITIDQSFTGSAELVTMFQAALEQDAITITCSSWERSVGGDYLHLAGTTRLLHMDNAEVSFSASERNGELLVTVAVTVPSGWRFPQSFPDLPGSYEPRSEEDDQITPSFLDELPLGVARLIFTNQAYHSEAFKTDLRPGLNFAGEVFFSGALAGLKTITGTDGPVFLTGPVREYRSAPDLTQFSGIRLRSPLQLAGGDWPIPVKNPSIYIKSPLNPLQGDPSPDITRGPGIYFFAEVDIAGRTAELVARYAHSDGPLLLCLYGRMTDFDLAGVSSLNQTVGGDDVQGSFPAEIQTPEGLQLTELALGADFTNLTISSVMVGMGMKTRWEIIASKLLIEEIGVSLRVSSPFNSKSRSLALTVSGGVAIGDIKLVAFAEYPTYRFGGALPKGATISLGDMIEAYFPGAPALPDMTITRLLFNADPKEKTFAMACSITDVLSIPVGATSFDIAGIGFAVNYSKSAGVTGAFTAEMTIAEATAVISGELTNTLTLTGSLRSFDLKKFWSLVTGGEALPDEVPDIIFEVLTVSVSPGAGDFSMVASTTIAWDHLSDDSSLKTSVQFSFARAGASITARLSLEGTGPIDIASGLRLDRFNFLFDYQKTIGWGLSGGVNVQIFDVPLSLTAAYEASQQGKKIKLQAIATPEQKLIALTGVGSYAFKQFDLLIDRRDAEGGGKTTYYDLRLASTLKIDGIFTAHGYLSIRKGDGGAAGLLFSPSPESAALDITFPAGAGIGLHVELFELGFVKESQAAGWSFTGSTYIGLTGLPANVAAALPRRMLAKLTAGKTSARIAAVNVTDPIGVLLPSAGARDLGRLFVQVIELGVPLKPELGLMAEAGLGFPAELNAFLGGHQVFRVYQKGDMLSMSRARFTIAKTGVAMQFITLPFAGANAVVINGESWFDIGLGQYGAISLKMPTFVYDGTSQYFEVGGGCKVTKPLSLPLSPLKVFLAACGSKDFADMFPDKVPIEAIALVDQSNNLKVDDLIAFMKKVGDVPSEVVQALKTSGSVLNRLPEGFKQYLKIEAPELLEFKFGFSPSGRISLALLAPQTPVRVLFPSVVQSYVPMPGLTGIQMRKLCVGTVSAGSLFFGEVDAVIDQFDMPSLALSLMLPANADFPLPTSNQLQRRLVLDDVFCMIPAGSPIPIPVFYDEIGFEYLGIEGLGLGAHISFPKPSVSGLLAFFTALKDFASDSTKRLDPNSPPTGLQLAFTFRDEFLQAPEYLGGGVLGMKGQEVTVSAWKSVAAMMNFFKSFSVNDFVEAIPYEYRVGSAQSKLSFLRMDADWLVTTPMEFKNGAFEQLKLTASDRDDFLTVLPSVTSSQGKLVKGNEQGLITFMRGQVELAFVRLEVVFGLVASGSLGFNTGFKIDGSIGSVIELEMSGAVMVNAPLAKQEAAVPATQTQAEQKAAEKAQAVALNGKDSWIEIPASDSLMLREYTIEMWLRPQKEDETWIQVLGIDANTSGHQRNFYLELNTAQGFYSHRFTDAKGGNSGAPNTANGTVKWGTWQHVAITNDGITAKTYIDGKEAASGAVNGALILFREPVFIGKSPSSPASRFFRGAVAEVRIYKHARTAAEIQAQMHELLRGDEKDLVSLYRSRSAMPNRALDVCGRNHGTIVRGAFVDSGVSMTSSTSTAPSTPGTLQLGGLIFNSIDYAFTPKSDKFNTAQYTIEAWVRPDKKQPDWQKCICGGAGAAPALYMTPSGAISHQFSVQTNATIRRKEYTASWQLRFDAWNHVAIANDGATFRTWVNGVLKSQGPVSGTLLSESTAIQIGRNLEGKNTELFRGNIDDIRLWSVARTESQIVASMHQPLTGREPGLVACYNMDDASGTTLTDIGPNKLHGKVQGAKWALAAAPSDARRAAVQIQGHTQLTIAGHKALTGDLRLVDSELWFTGTLDLFPKDWPIQVYGHVEGLLGEQRFYLRGETQNKLYGLVLTSSLVYISNDQIRLEGRWLGLYAVLDISWETNDPFFRGAVGFRASPTLNFGAIWIEGVKVADNVRLTVEIDANLDVVVSRSGFSADISVQFQIGGKGFSMTFGVDVAPSDLNDVITWIKQKIIDAPLQYLAHLFMDAATWLKNVAKSAIEFAKDSAAAVGAALQSAYGVAKDAVGPMMNNAGFAAKATAAVLTGTYKATVEDTAKALKAAAYAVQDVGAFLSSHGLDAPAVLNTLKSIGYGATPVVMALQSTFSKPYQDVAKLMKNAGYIANDVGSGIKSWYGPGVEDMAKALKDAGYSANDIAGVTKNVYSLTAKQSAQVLSRTLGYGKDTVKGALKAADYTSSAINDAIDWLGSIWPW